MPILMLLTILFALFEPVNPFKPIISLCLETSDRLSWLEYEAAAAAFFYGYFNVKNLDV